MGTHLGDLGADPAALSALIESKSGPTWDRYVGVIRPWPKFDLAAAASPISIALPADPVQFANWLITVCSRDVSYHQTKARCVAIDALSTLVGVATPTGHPLVRVCRNAARRTKRHSRGRVTPVLLHELPPPLPPPASPPTGGSSLSADLASQPRGTRGPTRGYRSEPSPGARVRRQAATARHMSLVLSAALRYDDTSEGQLGDILHFFRCG
jgi:hypothetical protein